ncbi:MAG: DUF5011 domain-containing protein [Candidatus Peribacteria bacterium]|nr:DUF5011 domain-containing protein [Candidatus Peribacteria bacterium]
MNGASLVVLLQNSGYTELGARWIDNYDGTGNIGTPIGSVNTTIIGDYPLTYSHTDQAGNT